MVGLCDEFNSLLGTVLMEIDRLPNHDDGGQRTIPELEADVALVQISAGYFQTVRLRSDGHAVAVGLNDDGQRTFPELEAGVEVV